MFIFGHQCRCRCQCQCWNADAKISKWPPQTKPCIVYCNRLSTVKIPAGIYLLKVNNRNTRTRCEICSNLTIKIPVGRSGIFIVKLWTYFTPCSTVSIVDFEHVNVSRDCTVSRLIAARSLALRREPTYDFRHSGRLWVALISSSFGKVVWFYTPRTSRRLSL